jgi:hypothetical protein
MLADKPVRGGHAQGVEAHPPAFYKQVKGPMFVVLLILIALLFPSSAEASCHTHKCWNKVHIHRVENYIQHKIDLITPYRCGPVQSVKPCWVVFQEASTSGYWRALNRGSTGTPCLRRACGLYQFLGWNVPWPVIIPGNKLETLRRKLAHHRQAARMSLSNW